MIRDLRVRPHPRAEGGNGGRGRAWRHKKEMGVKGQT